MLSARRYKIEWALLGFVVLILGVLIGYGFYREHADIAARERDRLQAQAQVIDENLGHQLKGMNDALANVLNEFPPGAAGSKHPETSRYLKTLTGAMPGVRTMSILDAQGTVLAASRERLAGQNFAYREYFTTPRARPEPGMLYVSTPFRTVETAVFSLNVGRVAIGSKGEFAGIVIATLDPDYFKVVLRSVLYAPDMTAYLVHADGKVFAAMPANESPLGKDLSMPGSNFSQFQEGGQAAAPMMGIDYTTGEQRMRALRAIRPAELKMDKPLVISVGRNVSAVFAPWRGEVIANGGFYGLFAALAGAGLYFSQRRRKSFHSAKLQSEQALRESEARLRFHTDNSLLAIVECDARFVVTRWAGTAGTMFGWSLEETIGKPIVDLRIFFEEDIAQVQEAIQRFASGEQRHAAFVSRSCTKDGKVIVCEWYNTVLNDSDGRLVSVMSQVVDITERRRAEQDLRDSAEKLRMFADNVPAMTVSYDEHLRCRFVNRRFAEFFGLTVETTLGMHLREVVGEKTYHEIQGHYERVLQGHPVTYHRTHTRQDGQSCELEIKLLPHLDGQGAILGCFSVAADITEHKLAEERFQRKAHHDSLTDLPNRLLFNDRLDQAISVAKRSSRQFALLYLDLDRFKAVNDTLGHAAGDELLKAVAARIRHQVRESDTVARVGGDEFTVILPDFARREEAEAVAGKIVAALGLPFPLGGVAQSIEIGTSIGIAVYPGDGQDADALVISADAAMYSAKRMGSGFRSSGT